MNQLQFIPQVKICPSRLVFFNSIEGLSRRDTFTTNFESNKPEGVISKNAAKRIRTPLSNGYFIFQTVKNGLLS